MGIDRATPLQGEKHTADTILRTTLFIGCELFCLISLILFLSTGQLDRILLCAVSPLLVCLPYAFEQIAHCRISTPIYAFCLLYAMGAMLGHSYKFYYIFPWWDIALHVVAGVVFAMLGAYLPKLLNRGNGNSRLLCAVFAVCFSLAIAVVWEFFEFGMDAVFSMDMQNDTVVTSIHSYVLGDELGVLGHMENIGSVWIDGTPLGLGGYLDIGLIDTMTDMLAEAAGAVLFAIAFLLDKGRHPVFTEADHPSRRERKLERRQAR